MRDTRNAMLIICVLLAFCQGLSAAPDKTSLKLMREPVSMMDWGCNKIALQTNDILQDAAVALTDVKIWSICAYDWDNDTINIFVEFSYQPQNALSKLDLQRLRTAIETIYTDLSAYKASWASYFVRAGYDRPDQKQTSALKQALLHKLKICFHLFPLTKIAEEQGGKLVFFDVSDERIAQ